MRSDDRPELVPYGWWPSSIGADVVAARSTSYDAVHTTGDTVAWLETRPADGCTVVATWTPGQGTKDATPDGFDVCTSIHAYGGGAYTYTPAGLVVVNAQDQRLHLIDRDGAALPITPPSDDRYGDLRPLDATTLVCVRERAGGPDDLVVLPLDGSTPPRLVHEGHDFYAFPRTSRDRRQLAWVTWDNPNLPWDGNDLWVADLLGAGLDVRLGPARHVAGGPDESVTQPEWGPDGALHFISDRSGWWNLHRERDQRTEPLLPMQAEFADASWELDYSTYTFLSDGRIACRYRRQGLDHLGILDPAAGYLEPVAVPFTSIKPYLRATRDRLRALTAATSRFVGGASWFGITDLVTFRAQVPRFQRHHTDHLVGPWPDAAPLYRERSPVHNAAQITQPVLVIYGLDDDIVPPEQAEAIIQAMRQRGVPVTQLAFPDEGHGLRHPDSIHRAIEAELTFYRVLLAGSP